MVNPETILFLQKECSRTNKEICGLISKNQDVYFIPNVSSRPQNSFLMDQARYFQVLNSLSRSGQEVLCIFHTHPGSPPDPSTKDLEYLRKSWVPMLIVSENSWRYLDGSDKSSAFPEKNH